MAGFFKAQIERARDVETLKNIIDDLAFEGLGQDDYFTLFDEATDKIAGLLAREW